MSISVNIGGNGRTAHATIIEGGSESRKRPVGLAVYTDSYNVEYYRPVEASDVSGSTSLNVDGTAFPADTDNVHNGIDTAYWTASATVGTWVFNSVTQAHTGTNSIDGTATVNGSIARFDRASSINPTDYEFLGGWIYISAAATGGGTKALNVQLYNSANAAIGASVDIYNYVDTTTLNTWQEFKIPMIAFGTSLGNDLDRLDLVVINTAGQPFDFYLDDLQFAEVGGRAFTIEADQGTHTNIYSLELTFVGTTTVTGTNQLNPLGFGFGSALPVGIRFGIKVGSFLTLERDLKTNADILSFPGADLKFLAGNGTTAIMKATLPFRVPVELNHTIDDYLRITVRDDLSGLLDLKFAAATTLIYDPQGNKV